ncbi:MAG: hypothetical protein IKA71_00540 [Lentisphaeria bacterium]|nr:hypothetical protein [Lentisphaeria bacterium]
MKKFLLFAFAFLLTVFNSGCVADKLPAEDIEVLEKHADIIKILRSPEFLPNSKEKYQAAKELIKYVDLHFIRETGTVNQLFYYRDAAIDSPGANDPIFTFTYQYADKLLRIRFFTYQMFVTRVEITEK